MPSFSSMFASDTVQDPDEFNDGTSDTGGSAPAQTDELAGPQSPESTGEGPGSGGDSFVVGSPNGSLDGAAMDDAAF